jgi:hypothetical protein
VGGVNIEHVKHSRGKNLCSKTKQSLFNPFFPQSRDLFLPFFTLFSPFPPLPPLSAPFLRCQIANLGAGAPQFGTRLEHVGDEKKRKIKGEKRTIKGIIHF